MHLTAKLFLIAASIIIVNVSNIETTFKAIDLTWSFENSTIYWPGIRGFSFTKIVTENTKDVWYAMNEFCAGEHGGTHLDAPYHFYKDGIQIGDITIDKLIVKGIVVDLSAEVSELGASAKLEQRHLIKWELDHGTIENNTVVLVKFGWAKHYTNKNTYLGFKDDNNQTNFPGLSKEAARWLADSNRVVGVGVDTASVDQGTNNMFDAHRILSQKQLYIVENVKLLDPLPVRNFTLLVMPMNIAQGTGAPVRLIAIINPPGNVFP